MLKYQKFFSIPGSDVIKSLNSRPSGLSSDEAKNRFKKYGPNLVEYKKPSWQTILLRQLNSFFIYLLAGAGIINLALGEYIDTGLIFLFIVIYALAGFYQEYKAENAIFHLRKFLLRYTRVKRNNETARINVQELVPGDIIFLKEGDLVPADVRFVRSKNLLIDESILTGESIPVSKNSALILEKEIKDDLDAPNLGFFGSTVVGGSAEAAVLSTGRAVYFAHIFEKINQIERPSLFEKNIQKIGKFLTKLILILAAIVFLVKSITGQSINWEFLVFIVALIVSVVPEVLPLVVTLALSNGALKMTKKNVVTKRLTAIEDLGDINVLCVDKTGTITKNHLTLVSYFKHDEKKLLKLAIISSLSGAKLGKLYNPFDKAIFERINRTGHKIIDEVKKIEFLEALPFDPDRKINSVAFKEGNKNWLVSRGAPEVILKFAAYYIDEKGEKKELKKDVVDSAMEWFKEHGLGGERILGISFKEVKDEEIDIKSEEKQGMIFAGLLSFNDPLKETSKEAFELLKSLGVQLKIITGDAREVAGAVGFELGLVADKKEVVIGEEFEALDIMAKKEAVKNCNIFARISPLNKYEIIETLRRENSVAFLGEGFNDVAALKISDVALAVNGASDMARNVSDFVLLEDDLSVIARGIEEGRKIFTNVIKYIRTTLAANIGNFFSIVFISLFLPFLPMLPIQILLVNLLSDLPMASIGVDNVSLNEIKKPQRYNLKYLYLFVIVFGITNSIFDFTYFSIFNKFGEGILQSGWFILSILTEIVAFFSLRTLLPCFKGVSPHKSIIALSLLSVFLTLILPFYPLTQNLFRFSLLSPLHFLTIFAIVLGYLIINEVVKLIYAKFIKES